jgi:hypothetical protein
LQNDLIPLVAKAPSTPVRLTARQQQEIMDRLKTGEPQARIADAHGVDRDTIRRPGRGWLTAGAFGRVRRTNMSPKDCTASSFFPAASQLRREGHHESCTRRPTYLPLVWPGSETGHRRTY